jgi:HK97 family phage portal protein
LNLVTRLAAGYLYKRGLLADPEGWLVRHFGGPRVHSGVQVDEFTAMQSTAVFAAVRLIAGTIASLPLPVYKREERAKIRDSNHPVYKLLHDRPNPEISSFQWRQTGIAHELLYGRWLNEIEYDNRGKIKALWPLPPWKVKMVLGARGFKYYDLTLDSGETVRIPGSRVLDIPNISVTGQVGMSCIAAGAEAIGLALAAEQFGARFFGEGTNLGGFLEHPGKIAPDRRQSFKDDIKAQYEGLGKSHKLMLLEEGMKYTRIGIPPNEAQFIETRKMQVAEIGRLFGITQLHKIGDLEKATFSNVEHLGIEFVTDTIRPHLVNVEQEFNYKLFPEGDNHFAEFLVDGLLRGDTETRYQAYATARQWGWMSANDIRELENMNPLPDKQGDIYLVPMNMIPADQVDNWEPKASGEPAERMEKRDNPFLRHAILRDKVARSYQGMYEETLKRIIQREKSHILRAAKKHLGERSFLTFNDWMTDFYKEFPTYIRKELMPVVLSMSEAVYGIAALEVGAEAVMTEDTRNKVSEYMDAYIARHIKESVGRIKAALDKPDSRQIEDEYLLEVEEQVEKWEEGRAGVGASDETTRIGNMIARYVFIAAGIIKLKWNAIGSESCEFCQQLNGKVVGIDTPFIAAGDEISGHVGGKSLTVKGPKSHPPIHKGCVCIISPST